jgi:hypothetical protein
MGVRAASEELTADTIISSLDIKRTLFAISSARMTT